MGQKGQHKAPFLKTMRRYLRRRLTPAEVLLWQSIRCKKLVGRKFQRQHSIDNYIVDFYCASEKLVIELDGESHKNPSAQQHDAERDSHLTNIGLRVIRIENKHVMHALESVLAYIESHFNTNRPQPLL